MEQNSTSESGADISHKVTLYPNKLLTDDYEVESSKISENIEEKMNKTADKRIFSRSATANYGLSVAKRTFKASSRLTKKAAVRFNPLDKPVNKNDTTDTGTEALKLGYRATKKTYQTGKKTVRGVRVLYKAPVKTARIAVGTVKLAGSLAVHTAAVVLSPVFWIAAFIVLIVSVLIIPVVLILAGGAAGGTTTNKAYGTAAGTDKEITTAYPEAEEYYRIASEKRKNDFNSMIDSLYYSTDDLSHSDLVYMKCSHDGSDQTKHQWIYPGTGGNSGGAGGCKAAGNPGVVCTHHGSAASEISGSHLSSLRREVSSERKSAATGGGDRRRADRSGNVPDLF